MGSELNRGQKFLTSFATFGDSRSLGTASSMILSQSRFQVSSSPSSAFCSAIGVGGAGFSCACGGVTGDWEWSSLLLWVRSKNAKPIENQLVFLIIVRCL